MSKNKQQSTYYDILRISPYASDNEIRRAIDKMRLSDRNKHYVKLLAQIEDTLLNTRARMEYNKKHGISFVRGTEQKSKKNKFVDLNKETVEREEARARSNNIYNSYRAMQDESANRQIEIGRRYTSRRAASRFIFLIIFLVILILSAKPALNYLNAKKQVEAAHNDLVNVKNIIIKEIGENGTFIPDNIKLPPASNDAYSLSIHPSISSIKVSFNSNAVRILEGHSMELFLETRPNLTFWKCVYSNDFPKYVKHIDCF